MENYDFSVLLIIVTVFYAFLAASCF